MYVDKILTGDAAKTHFFLMENRVKGLKKIFLSDAAIRLCETVFCKLHSELLLLFSVTWHIESILFFSGKKARYLTNYSNH
jgi:hypothetical protein